jgi:hypothetical protein
MTRTRLAAAYLVLQSVGIAAWWLLLATLPDVRSFFERPGAFGHLVAFAPGDVSVVALGLYGGVRRGRGAGTYAVWLVAGAMLYAALYTVADAVWHSGPLLDAALMTPAALTSLWAAAVLSPGASSRSLSPGADSPSTR